MLDDERMGGAVDPEMVHVGTNDAAIGGGGRAAYIESARRTPGEADRREPSWREIDRRLRTVATTRAGLDAEELLWLARAERVEIHRHFACATILEYVERVLGYGPRVARERLRVARALEILPRLRAELESARLSYSAVRELSRVAQPWNEDRWIARTAGCSLREIEQHVAGHKPGDDPDDPPDPDLAPRPITLELTSRTLALFRDASRRLEDEVGHPLTDDELIATLCAGALRDPQAPAAPDCNADGPAPYQVALTLCLACKRATHDASGRSFDVPPSAVEQALCNPQYIGRVDDAVPARATRDVPPAVARLVWRRDGGHCVVPGCRSTRHIEVHHVQFRSRGGDHSPGNLACLCFAHHAALHEGRLVITGTAPDQLTFQRIDPLLLPDRPPPVSHRAFPATRPPPQSAVPADAHRALVTLGFSDRESTQALARAAAHVDHPDLETLIRAALRELTPKQRR